MYWFYYHLNNQRFIISQNKTAMLTCNYVFASSETPKRRLLKSLLDHPTNLDCRGAAVCRVALLRHPGGVLRRRLPRRERGVHDADSGSSPPGSVIYVYL